MNNKYVKATQHAADQLITAILSGEFQPGTALPGERVLAESLGITRPTLRENLQRLAAEGWVTIHHGKATRVNDFWKTGGLGILSTLARYAQFLPGGFVDHLLCLRLDLIPAMAARACKNRPDAISAHLAGETCLTENPEDFAKFDWELQRLFAEHSQNPVYPMILNDFSSLFEALGAGYFHLEEGRTASRRYYQKLRAALEDPAQCEEAKAQVALAMEESISIWKKISRQNG